MREIALVEVEAAAVPSMRSVDLALAGSRLWA